MRSLRNFLGIFTFLFVIEGLTFSSEEEVFHSVENIYSYTLSLCNNYQGEPLYDAFRYESDLPNDINSRLIFQSSSSKSLLSNNNHLKSNLFLKKLMESKSFDRALDTCFGENTRVREDFMRRLKIADIQGRIIALSIEIGLAYGAGKLMKLLGLIPMPSFIKNFTQKISKLSAKFSKIGYPSLLFLISSDSTEKPEIVDLDIDDLTHKQMIFLLHSLTEQTDES